jgi:putative spermidine/putrescine transport system permease protein
VEQRSTRVALAVWTALVILFLWFPLALIMVYAFNKANVQSWPIPGFTDHWFSVAWHSQDVRDALWLSVRVALVATGVALVLGSMAAFGVARVSFLGRDAVSFIHVLPATSRSRCGRSSSDMRRSAS